MSGTNPTMLPFENGSIVDPPEETSDKKQKSDFRRLAILVFLLLVGILFSMIFSTTPTSSTAVALVTPPTLHKRSSTSSALPPPSMDELQSFVHYAYAAFCPDETLQDWTCAWCSDSNFRMIAILYNQTTETRGFVGYLPSQNQIVASFRGSRTNANWILDLEPGITQDFYGVTVRKGWLLAYHALQEQLWNALRQIHQECPSCRTFTTTGHSLGAAIAGLAVLDVRLSAPWIRSAGIRTFGMPRVGYKDFVRLFAQTVESSFRVVHFRDIVPHYPLRTQKGFMRNALPYHHVGAELWEPKEEFDGTLRHCDGTGEDPHCSASLPMWHWDPSDHMTYLGIPNDNCEPKVP